VDEICSLTGFLAALAERFNPSVTREKQNGINGRSSGSFRVNYRGARAKLRQIAAADYENGNFAGDLSRDGRDRRALVQVTTPVSTTVFPASSICTERVQLWTLAPC
jgi:hypothetical protein